MLDHLARPSNPQLSRLYTQNIDGLEGKTENLKPRIPLGDLVNEDPSQFPNTILVHGSMLHTACGVCEHVDVLDPSVFGEARMPPCPVCQAKSDKRVEDGHRQGNPGYLRARTSLYGQAGGEYDAEGIGIVMHVDGNSAADLFLVAGTSVKITAIKTFVKNMCERVRRNDGITIWVNVVPPPSSMLTWFDLKFIGTADEFAAQAGF
jgi:NAD-dependent histone deacetylase SIR2